MSDGYIGVIWALGFSFAPHNWGYCNGTILAVTQNTALFSLIGAYYGGDGRSSFGLPDLRSRAAIGQFTGPGLPTFTIGGTTGAPLISLSAAHLPPHTHTHSYAGGGGSGQFGVIFEAAAQKGTKKTPDDGDYLAAPASALALTDNLYVPQADVTATATLGGVTVASSVSGFDNSLFTINDTGNSASFSSYQPSLAINYCICMTGIYPSRN
ncbi:phage tail protein [Thalassospira marina]|uniref:Phage tail collar domain-containing protein n=1 Tax=Thalassospira marina TaxID=2048283 RepID=A0A2N3KBT9_9PROT|nr:tail fiber protein [Thalassospira marina]AUG54027.1 hypothetical protein CSC3H3_15830 [Thalassospira marina]PKR47976.1 hypothetical protein COO20_25240 [Thalassospira marina]